MSNFKFEVANIANPKGIWFDHRLTGYAADGARLKRIDFAGGQAFVLDAIKPWTQLVNDFGSWPVVLPSLLLLLVYGVLLARLHSPRMLLCCLVMACMVALLSPGALLLLRDSFLLGTSTFLFGHERPALLIHLAESIHIYDRASVSRQKLLRSLPRRCRKA